MTVPGIAFQRLFNQRLQGKTCVTAAEVVRHLGAVQAQDYRGGLWGVGLRMKSATEEKVEKALADRSIVRTWPMRGTLHLVAAEDVRWMLPVLTPRVVARSAGRLRQLELTTEDFKRARRLVEKALRGGGLLTRLEMYQAFEEAGITPRGQRGIHLLQWLAHAGVLCFGPRKGKQQTFVLLEEWIPQGGKRSREESLAELALRYFGSHGPATVRDFAWWAGLTLGDANTALASVTSRLSREEAGGEQYYGPPGVPPRVGTRAAVRPGALLLPPFDELLVGYKDRSAAVDPRHAGSLASLLSPTIVLGGRVVGTWTRRDAGARVIVQPQLLEPEGRGSRGALSLAARLYGEFVGKTGVLA